MTDDGDPDLALASALSALQSDRRERALVHLLAAWRACRHSRIADVIQYVSDDITARLRPIKAKTVAARTEKWHEIEKTRDPCVLGQLLATPWPKTWQNALPVLQPLCQWPGDPRLSLAFARILLACPFDTYTSHQFYQPLIRTMAVQRDLRTLPILRQCAGKKHSWFADSLASIAEIIRRLESSSEPALEPRREALIAALESGYRERIDVVQEKAAGQVDHLAAIYANPEDIAARAVYADWLGELGDPRGELITLQLARASGTATDAASARERKLVEKHGKEWAGSLDQWFEDEARVFEGGFFAGGTLRSRYALLGRDRTIDEMLQDPAWALVRRLRGNDDFLGELVGRPELRGLRRVGVLYFDAASKLLPTLPPSITEVHWQWEGPSGPRLEELVAFDSPALRELGCYGDNVDVFEAWMRAGPVFERLVRIVLYRSDPRYVAALAKRGGSLREIEIAWGGWRFLLKRDAAPGPFTRLAIRSDGGPHRLATLPALLDGAPAESLRELVIATSKKLTSIPKGERDLIASAIARFDKLERRELPWPELVTPAATSRPAQPRTGPLLELRLDGEGLLDLAKLDAVWRIFVDVLGQRYDSFEVGYGSAFRSLGDDPFARVKKWTANPKTQRLELKVDGQRDMLAITRQEPGDRACYTTAMIVLGGPTPETFIDAFVELLDLARFEDGSVSDAGQPDRVPELGVCGARSSGGWLRFYGGEDAARMRARIAALTTRPELAGLLVRETVHGLLVGLAATPEAATAARQSAYFQALREIAG